MAAEPESGSTRTEPKAPVSSRYRGADAPAPKQGEDSGPRKPRNPPPDRHSVLRRATLVTGGSGGFTAVGNAGVSRWPMANLTIPDGAKGQPSRGSSRRQKHVKPMGLFRPLAVPVVSAPRRPYLFPFGHSRWSPEAASLDSGSSKAHETVSRSGLDGHHGRLADPHIPICVTSLALSSFSRR